MHIVAWNTAIPVLNICNDPFGYESENKAKPDTFEAYAIALRDAAYECICYKALVHMDAYPR